VKAVAEESIRFRLGEDDSYTPPEKLSGPDRCGYDFRIEGCQMYKDMVKFQLRTTRYVVGRPPTNLFGGAYSIKLGEHRQIDGLAWNFRLERIEEGIATLVLQKRTQPRRDRLIDYQSVPTVRLRGARGCTTGALLVHRRDERVAVEGVLGRCCILRTGTVELATEYHLNGYNVVVVPVDWKTREPNAS
jgi:hypothetical protein